MTKEQISKRSSEVLDEMIEVRRHLHQFPELSFQEYKTSEFIQNKLNEWGISYQKSEKTTGIFGLIKSDINPNYCIALRADMDALPIHELNETEYKSKNNGVMHACGHDVHTTFLLGALKIINENRSNLPCSIKFIFQPGEEKLPGGASILIEEGVLENPKVDEIFGLHVFPELEVGKVGIKEGMYMASCDEIFVEIIGKGGHGAMPHQNVDPILISAHVLTSIQQVVSRNCPPEIPSVLSFGKIIGEGATNIIPNQVNLEGTFRTMDEEWREKAHEIIKNHIKGIAKSMGAEALVNIIKGYPFLENDIELTLKSKKKLNSFFGEENVVNLPLRMTGEDFSFYGRKTKANFIRIGTKNEKKGIVYPVHHAKFDIDESAIKIGIETFLTLVYN